MKKNTSFYKLIISLLFILTGSMSASAQTSYVDFESYQLDNGLTVILSEDHSQQKVFGSIIVKAGGKDDPVDATGMAHYQEHMLFKGTDELGTINWAEEKIHIDRIFELYDELGQTTDETKRLEIQQQINAESMEANKYAIPNEMSNIIKSMGGTNLNAGTGMDQTVFYNAFPPNEIERWIELYSHRFINPVFRGFQAELEVVYEEKNLYEDMFQTQLINAFNKRFYKNHPYGQQTIIGTTDDLKNPSLTKMFQFFKTWYVPNNMALVIVGDFNIDEIKPIIAEKFGKLQRGNVPERIVYTEEPFEGREFFEDKLSPIKLAVMGFRTVPAGHPDELALNIVNSILSNQNQTGLLDALALNNELLAAMAIPMINNDHGSTIFFIIPKIVGQSLEDAEQLVLDKIGMLKNGDFSDELFESVKQNSYKDFILSLEDLQQKALLFSYIFARGQKINDYLDNPEKIKKITKQDIIDIANKYYGEDFLILYSKMGSPDKQKIDKPGYEPLITNTDKKSPFAIRFEKMKVLNVDINYVDFNNDLTKTDLSNGNKLYLTNNPINNIFSFAVKIGIGETKEPLLEYATELMNYSGTETNDLSELKSGFSILGTSYYIYSDDNYITIRLKGLDENFEASIELLNELLSSPKLAPEKLDIIVEGIASARKMETSEPANVADALFEYMKYGSKSEYIDRLKIKEIKKLDTEKLIEKFQNSLKYETEYHYVGKIENQEIKRIIEKNLTFTDQPLASELEVIDIQKYTENTILFVDKPKALQSKVYFMINGVEYQNIQLPYINAFNQYFGGGFSGLVLQEIREYRSMAYSAGAWYSTPKKEGIPTIFYGFVGTQADKTIGAIDIFHGLIREMPEKSERIGMIKHFLEQSALTSTPSFRTLSTTVSNWETKGYTQDPRIDNIKKYQALTFDEIVKFYTENIKDKPLVIAIVGDKDRIDLNKLKKYGNIIEIKEKDLFN